MRMRLSLSNGYEFEGISFGASREAIGEVVFNTGMVGYPETLTDPSYRGQILVLTYPLIGNYGVPLKEQRITVLPKSFESDRIQVAGLIVQEYSHHFSHWASEQTLRTWLTQCGVPAITGVDTRSLTMLLRDEGVMPGAILRGNRKRDSCSPLENPNALNLVQEVSCKNPIIYKRGRGRPHGPKILLYDLGVKYSIIRSLINRGCTVIRVPWDYDISQSPLQFEGIVLSSGPGNPKMCTPTIDAIRYAMVKQIPMLGICLGSQIMALAAGGNTYKLKYGHRSQNQPCIEIGTNRCYITTQNHGYAVQENTLPKKWKVWFRNANDRTIEGFRSTTKPSMAVQFHPEANPGPTDTDWIFDEFLKRV